ncbi:hypothetical protein [Saccharothrix luteola]|uniref:hypothetical protein n=1 Tax=Saccharothrix luteola TaxID=2893018 RepID=UPI001E29C17A|nr:hypothetical protein [Saccharothrix luteola]MCC8247690.1 hypothetical protein [Saccharothrix luteola]
MRHVHQRLNHLRREDGQVGAVVSGRGQLALPRQVARQAGVCSITDPDKPTRPA